LPIFRPTFTPPSWIPYEIKFFFAVSFHRIHLISQWFSVSLSLSLSLLRLRLRLFGTAGIELSYLTGWLWYFQVWCWMGWLFVAPWALNS
jgi:hypothetical protein